jgi:hypothetical protein
LYRRALPRLTDAAREEIRRPKVAIIEDYAEGTLLRLQNEDASRAHYVEADGYRRKKRGMRRKVGAAKLVDLTEVRVQIAEYLKDLKRLDLKPTPWLVKLQSYVTGRVQGKPKAALPFDERADFQAAVSYAVAHPCASARAIGRAAGVDHKTIANWRRLPAWDRQVEIAQTLQIINWASGE